MKTICVHTGVVMLLIAFVGCARFPYQDGAWTGTIRREKFYSNAGQYRDVLCLEITEGPTMSDNGFHPFRVPDTERDKYYCTNPIIVDGNLKAFNSYTLEGERATISGRIQGGPAKDPWDGAEIVSEKAGAVPGSSHSPLVIRTKRQWIKTEHRLHK